MGPAGDMGRAVGRGNGNTAASRGASVGHPDDADVRPGDRGQRYCSGIREPQVDEVQRLTPKPFDVLDFIWNSPRL